jgi:hypothetical protein
MTAVRGLSAPVATGTGHGFGAVVEAIREIEDQGLRQ